MNRLYNQFRLALEKRIVDLYAQVAIGATGAPTLNLSKSKGIASITRNSAGLYTIVLQDNYVDLLMFNHAVFLAAGAPSAVGGAVIRANNVAATAKSIQVLFVDNAGAAVELDNGTNLFLQFSLKASTV